MTPEQKELKEEDAKPVDQPVESEPNGMIYGKILSIMEEVGEIIKAGRVKFGKTNYSYRGIDDVYNHMHPLLRKHRVFTQSEIISETREVGRTKNGDDTVNAVVRYRYIFTAEDGSSASVEVTGEGTDTADKASSKAMSTAYKYAMFQMFCIPTELHDNDETPPPADTPDPSMPNTPSRQDRSAGEVEVAELTAIREEWQRVTGKSSGNEFVAWVLGATGRKFDPRKQAEWVKKDTKACDEELMNMEREGAE